MKNNLVLFCLIVISFLQFQDAEAKCIELAKRYYLSFIGTIGGNVSTSTPTTCGYNLRQARKRGNNKYIYSGTDCEGYFRQVEITKTCNNIFISLPVGVNNLAVDAFGDFVAATGEEYISCNGYLGSGKTISASCSGTNYFAGNTFIINGSLNAYSNRITQLRSGNLHEQTKQISLNNIDKDCNDQNNKDYVLNCDDNYNPVAGASLLRITK